REWDDDERRQRHNGQHDSGAEQGQSPLIASHAQRRNGRPVGENPGPKRFWGKEAGLADRRGVFDDCARRAPKFQPEKKSRGHNNAGENALIRRRESAADSFHGLTSPLGNMISVTAYHHAHSLTDRSRNTKSGPEPEVTP